MKSSGMTSLMEVSKHEEAYGHDDQGALWQTNGLALLQMTSFHSPSAFILIQCWKYCQFYSLAFLNKNFHKCLT